MCVVSMVVDDYKDRWGRRPYEVPYPGPYMPGRPPQLSPEEQARRDKENQEQLERITEMLGQKFPKPEPITAQEIEEFRRLLDRAREYDKRNNEPDCESETKIKELEQIVRKLGVSEEKVKRIMDIVQGVDTTTV